MGRKDKPAALTGFVRAYPLEDIAIRSGGDGRTVEAYAAVFNRTARVTDLYRVADNIFDDEFGTYDELIRNTAFDKTLAERGTNFQVLFNHGKDVYGVPAERYAMPLGTPVEVRADARGLLTVTRYAKTPLADEVLELIREGAIRSMSFGGRIIQSKITRATRPGDVDLVERVEIALREFGPAVFPAYEDAAIVSVRTEELADQLTKLPSDERRRLIALLSTPDDEAGGDPATTSRSAPDDPEGDDTDTSDRAADTPAPATGPSLERLLLEQEQRRRKYA